MAITKLPNAPLGLRPEDEIACWLLEDIHSLAMKPMDQDKARMSTRDPKFTGPPVIGGGQQVEKPNVTSYTSGGIHPTGVRRLAARLSPKCMEARYGTISGKMIGSMQENFALVSRCKPSKERP